MANSEETVKQFREELHQVLVVRRESLMSLIKEARAQFVETFARLESEVEAASAPSAEQLEQQLLQTLEPLIAYPQELTQQLAALNSQIENLTETARQHGDENARLRLENSELNEQVSKSGQERAEKDELIARLTQERQELEQRVASAVEEYTQAKAQASLATKTLLQRLLSSLEQIEGKRSQVDILTAFLEEVSHFAARVVLFVSKAEMFSGWRSFGFGSESFSGADVKMVHFSVQDDTILRQAFDEKRMVEGNRHSHSENRAILERLGAPIKDSFVAIPLVVKDKSTAVLYADGGLTPEGSYDIETLELLVRLVSLSIELLAYRVRGEAPHRPGIRVSGSTPEKGSGASPSFEEAGASVMPPMTGTSLREPSPSAKPAYPLMPPAPSGNEEREKLHNDAKRFARLLVSEIKLYNEQKVLEGRKHRDLYDRLKEDIDRSREMYRKRVSPVVSKSVDYFYDELVRQLGENDASALGSDCPGPMLESAD